MNAGSNINLKKMESKAKHLDFFNSESDPVKPAVWQKMSNYITAKFTDD